MQNSDGFYKLDGSLLYGPNFVVSANYELRRDSRAQYVYPVDGWFWFDSRAEARAYFGLPEENADGAQLPGNGSALGSRSS